MSLYQTALHYRQAVFTKDYDVFSKGLHPQRGKVSPTIEAVNKLIDRFKANMANDRILNSGLMTEINHFSNRIK